MTDHITAMRQALEALTNCTSEHGHRCNRCDSEVDPDGAVATALRAALAQQQGEPVAVVLPHENGPTVRLQWASVQAAHNAVPGPLYAAPPAAPAAKREPLTDEAVDIGHEWTPCVKLPITVHVRAQRPGESHISTREGITPVRPDDLIMRGVAGEEYPIGRELFERTYRIGTAPSGIGGEA